MINSLVSFLLPNGGSRVDDDDRLSSVGSTESGSQSRSTTSQDLDRDCLHSIGGPSSSSPSTACATVKVPETAHTLGRSASSPPALRRANTASSSPTPYQHQKLSRSTHSLRPQALPPIKPLSPIYEPLDLAHDDNDTYVVASPVSVQPSPSSLRERVAAASQGTHQAFLNRSLKRSISQNSSSSLRSEASGAPKLPPLNLRPYFRDTTGSFVSSSQLSPPSAQSCHTPQSVTTPRSHKFGSVDTPSKYSAIYEDGSSERTGSFVTAHSVSIEPGPSVVTKHETPSTANPVGHTSALADVNHTEDEDPGVILDRDSIGACSDLEQGSTGSRSVCSIASTTTRNNSDNGVEDLRDDVEGESFVMRRWQRGIFGLRKNPDEFIQAKGGRAADHRRHACALFWLGFLAPWCWLIGGWMLPQKTEVQVYSDHILMRAEEGKLERSEEKKGYLEGLKNTVLPHPSRFAASSSVLSTSSLVTLYPKEKQEERARLNVWISRCRVAAFAGGLFLLSAVLITLSVII